jgi:hypothetical protein
MARKAARVTVTMFTVRFSAPESNTAKQNEQALTAIEGLNLEGDMQALLRKRMAGVPALADCEVEVHG